MAAAAAVANCIYLFGWNRAVRYAGHLLVCCPFAFCLRRYLAISLFPQHPPPSTPPHLPIARMPVFMTKGTRCVALRSPCSTSRYGDPVAGGPSYPAGIIGLAKNVEDIVDIMSDLASETALTQEDGMKAELNLAKVCIPPLLFNVLRGIQMSNMKCSTTA